jgi:hypothetical protein
MTIKFDQITEFNNRVYRNIQGMLAGIDEFDDLTTNKSASAYAHRAVEKSSRPFSVDELNFHAIDFVFMQTSWLSSRFCNGSYPVWYGSVDLTTSFYETSFHWRKIFIDAPQGFHTQGESIRTSRRVFTVACHAALIDLRNKVKQHEELIHPDTSRYPTTQAVGERIYQEGYPGLLTKSARHLEGENVVIFRRKILAEPKHYHDYIYEYHLADNKTLVRTSPTDKIILAI